jgi:hypothetical protein
MDSDNHKTKSVMETRFQTEEHIGSWMKEYVTVIEQRNNFKKQWTISQNDNLTFNKLNNIKG